MSQVDTGDILLFNTGNFGGGLIRIGTNSSVDHIALCVFITIKKKDLEGNMVYTEELCLLESINSGV